MKEIWRFVEKRWLLLVISAVVGVLIGAAAADLPALGRVQFFIAYGDFLGSIVGGLIAVLVAWRMITHERQEMRRDRLQVAAHAAAGLQVDLSDDYYFVMDFLAESRSWDLSDQAARLSDKQKQRVSEFESYPFLKSLDKNQLKSVSRWRPEFVGKIRALEERIPSQTDGVRVKFGEDGGFADVGPSVADAVNALENAKSIQQGLKEAFSMLSAFLHEASR